MKKALFACLAIGFLVSSCGKDDPAPVNPAATPYMTTTNGASWNYKDTDNANSTSTTYTLTSTNRDSTVGTRSYHVYTNSTDGSSEYYNVTGAVYYRYASLTDILPDPIELIYLQDNKNVGESWSQNISFDFSGVPLTATVTNTVEEKGGSLIVNGTTYTNVIKVRTDISVAGLPPGALVTNIHSYYAPKYGNIRTDAVIDLDYLGVTQSSDVTTTLESSNIQ